MTNKHMSDLMDDLKADLERRYNIKCRFRESCVGIDKIELLIFLENGIISGVNDPWHFIYYFDPHNLIINYNSVLGDIMIKFENEWMNRLYRK